MFDIIVECAQAQAELAFEDGASSVEDPTEDDWTELAQCLQLEYDSMRTAQRKAFVRAFREHLAELLGVDS